MKTTHQYVYFITIPSVYLRNKHLLGTLRQSHTRLELGNYGSDIECVYEGGMFSNESCINFVHKVCEWFRLIRRLFTHGSVHDVQSNIYYINVDLLILKFLFLLFYLYILHDIPIVLIVCIAE